VVLARGNVITAADVRSELDEQLEFLTQAAPFEAEALPAIAHTSPTPQVLAQAPASPPAAAAPAAGLHFSSAVRPLKEDLRRTEHRAITKALASAKGNRALAARLLGVSRRTLYTKLEEHGIE
jgi:two-component system response regulator AtoC